MAGTDRPRLSIDHSAVALASCSLVAGASGFVAMERSEGLAECAAGMTGTAGIGLCVGSCCIGVDSRACTRLGSEAGPRDARGRWNETVART